MEKDPARNRFREIALKEEYKRQQTPSDSLEAWKLAPTPAKVSSKRARSRQTYFPDGEYLDATHKNVSIQGFRGEKRR